MPKIGQIKVLWCEKCYSAYPLTYDGIKCEKCGADLKETDVEIIGAENDRKKQ